MNLKCTYFIITIILGFNFFFFFGKFCFETLPRNQLIVKIGYKWGIVLYLVSLNIGGVGKKTKQIFKTYLFLFFLLKQCRIK